MNQDKLYEELAICKEKLERIKNVISVQDVDSLLHDVESYMGSIKEMLQGNSIPSNILQKALTCCLNMEDSISRFFLYPEKKHRIFFYEINISFSQMDMLIHWKYDLFGNPLEREKYRDRLMKSLEDIRKNPSPEGKYKYKVSICVTGYNKLEYTKRAIESIMKYTDFSSGDIELITSNNGSTDGTEEYFESLPHEKKLNFKHNLVAVPSSFAMVAEGQYIVEFSNDVVATPHWLEQLLYCMESAPDIAMIVPTCNEDSISHGQGIPIPYRNDFNDMESMQEFAVQYNHSNPRLWEERPILMPFVNMQRMEIVALHLSDPAYVKSFFSDDDLSTMLRRTGWRMILAKDTFLHHFGSITHGKATNEKNTAAIVEMRRVYYEKWGIDAWESGGNIPSFHEVARQVMAKENSSILWLEPKFCLDFLQLKNDFRKKGCVHSDAILLDERYILDAKPYFDRCFHVSSILDAIPELRETYDVIGMGSYFHEIIRENPITDLERLYGLLKPGGVMLVPVKNFGSASSLLDLVQSGGSSQYGGTALTVQTLNVRRLVREITQHKDLRNVRFQGLSLLQDTNLGDVLGLRLANLFTQTFAPNVLKDNLKLSMMWFCFIHP